MMWTVSNTLCGAVVKTGIKAARARDIYRVNVTCARNVQGRYDTTRESVTTDQRLDPNAIVRVLLKIPITLVNDESIQPVIRSKMSASRSWHA